MCFSPNVHAWLHRCSCGQMGANLRSFQDIVKRLLKQWSVIAVALMLMDVEWNVQQSHMRVKYRCPHTTSGCQHSFCHRMYIIFNFRLNDVQISAFLCGDLKYWASVLTLEDLLHCEWSVLQTGANTSLQAEAQIPAFLLQTHTHTLTWESRKTHFKCCRFWNNDF